jgi:hypothetical protein
MARTPADISTGTRITDYISLSLEHGEDCSSVRPEVEPAHESRIYARRFRIGS